MPIQTDWYNAEQTIIIQQFLGDWTVDDYITNIETTRALVDSVRHTVHIITDMTHQSMPPVKVLTANRWVESHVQDNVGVKVLVNAGHFIENLVRLSRPVMPRTFRDTYFARSVDEALQIIERESSGST